VTKAREALARKLVFPWGVEPQVRVGQEVVWLRVTGQVVGVVTDVDLAAGSVLCRFPNGSVPFGPGEFLLTPSGLEVGISDLVSDRVRRLAASLGGGAHVS
jgi:hypothetical protein